MEGKSLKRWNLVVLFFFLLLVSRTVFAASATGTFPAELTTRDALFDAAVDLLRRSGFPPTVADRERGLIECSLTVHHTMSPVATSVEKFTTHWKVLIDKAPDGSWRTAADLSSESDPDPSFVPESERRTLTQFFRNLAVSVRVGASKVALTLDGETKPLSDWTKRSR